MGVDRDATAQRYFHHDEGAARIIAALGRPDMAAHTAALLRELAAHIEVMSTLSKHLEPRWRAKIGHRATGAAMMAEAHLVHAVIAAEDARAAGAAHAHITWPVLRRRIGQQLDRLAGEIDPRRQAALLDLMAERLRADRIYRDGAEILRTLARRYRHRAGVGR